MGERLLASGLDSDIFEHGPNLVRKRTRKDRSIEDEARIMQYAAANQFPVPRVDEVRCGGAEIIMERLEGPLMMDVVSRRPHTMMRNARLLADLHDRLHEIQAPTWVRQMNDGADRLLHLDLHPLNVIMTNRGPVVIDWSNAASGDPLTDVGLTYVLLTCPRAPMPRLFQIAIRPFRLAMANSFSKRYRGPNFFAHTALAAELKMLDPNMLPDEVENCRRLAERLRAVH
jgi:aminoglycoside phosphotransferase (APT) family kinase protein